MRNLIEFPITADEIIDYLQRLVKEENSSKEFVAGNMSALLAATALEVVRAATDINEEGKKGNSIYGPLDRLEQAFESQNIKS